MYLHICFFSLQVTHLHELSEDTRNKVGNTEEELMEYMMKQFPDLLLYVWLGASKCRSNARLQKYYTAFHER